MKILGFIFLFFLSIANSFAGNLAPRAEKKIISLRADDWCPYNCDPKSDHPGFLIEIAKMILEPKGYIVDYQLMPWARARAEAGDGKIDGIVGAFYSDAPGFSFPSEALGLATNCFYTLKDSKWVFKSVSDLEHIVMGAIQGYTYDESIDNYIRKYQSDQKRVDLVHGDGILVLQNLEKLMRHRIGTFIEDKNVLHYQMNTHSKTEGVREAGCLLNQKVFIAFSPKLKIGKDLAQMLSDGFKKLRSSGQLKRILKIYGARDWY